MARIFEYQGKALLEEFGFHVPRGKVAESVEEAVEIARDLGGDVVLKSQLWSTKRAEHGGIRFATTLEEVEEYSASMLGQTIQQFRVERILVEEQIPIAAELFAAVLIDGAQRCPRVLFSTSGGSGIEENARNPSGNLASKLVDVQEGFHAHHGRDLARRAGSSGKEQILIGQALVNLYNLARACEARSAEINPLVLTTDGQIVADDCRIAIDDYAVFRHPELGIEIAREFQRPPTPLDRIAYEVEREDYRGTFYFMQMANEFERGEGFIGFHGAGGGGSMMAMDALVRQGFSLANFTDTSGNPPASKVYRAARIILSQPHLDGYFGCGSGVASQEQPNSSRGLAKAFREEPLTIPAVVRLGGNGEDRAVALLHKYTQNLSAPVEGYKKDDTADACAARLAVLIEAFEPLDSSNPTPVYDPGKPYRFDTLTGSICYDHALCNDCESKACIAACEPGILKLEADLPVLAITVEEAQSGGCTECLACELECAFEGNRGAFISLPIEGLSGYRSSTERKPEAVE